MFVDESERTALVDGLVKDDHGAVFSVGIVVQVSGEDGSEITTDDNDLVLVQISSGWFTLASNATERGAGDVAEGFEERRTLGKSGF